MRVLGIYCSPRKGGNSDVLLDEALRSAENSGAETVRIYARDLIVAPCRACHACDKTGRCVMRDDFDGVAEHLDAADAAILSTPIHFYTISAHGMFLIDRAQQNWAARYVLKDERVVGRPLKPAALIAVGGTMGKKLFDGIKLTAHYFFYASGFSLKHNLLVPGVDRKDEVFSHEDVMKQASELGSKLISDISQ